MSYPRRSKFNAKRTELDGIKFASQKEAKRYRDLRLAEKAGLVSNLKLQVPFVVKVSGIKICTYYADFVYNDEYGRQKVEDSKGVLTPVYRLKKKLVEALYPIKILET